MSSNSTKRKKRKKKKKENLKKVLELKEKEMQNNLGKTLFLDIRGNIRRRRRVPGVKSGLIKCFVYEATMSTIRNYREEKTGYEISYNIHRDPGEVMKLVRKDREEKAKHINSFELRTGDVNDCIESKNLLVEKRFDKIQYKISLENEFKKT